jgi:cell division protein FtsL
VLGLLGAIGSLAGQGAIDRLIRGRIWIGVIAFALIGIVTLQLLVLQLNANIGRALVREAQLQRGNAALSIEDSELAGGERVEARAARLGMQLVPVGSLRFLTSYPSADIARAAAALRTPVHSASASAATGVGSGTTAAAGSGETAAASTSAGASAEGAEATGSAAQPQQSAEPQQSVESAQSAARAPASENGTASSPQAATGATGEAPAHESTAPAPAPASAPAGAAGGTEATSAG